MNRLRTARPRAALRQGRNDWYQILRNAALPTTVAVHIYDEIGYWGITASDLIGELSSLDATHIDLHINSPGGEIFDGIAIMNALRSHPAAVTTYVDSLAASIASVIAMAGDQVIMQPHSQMMIHDGSGLCVGDAADMRELADLLDRQSDNIASIYAAKAGGTTADWRARMQAETWYTAAEAVAAGLADKVAPAQPEPDADAPGADRLNTWDLTVFNYAGREQAPDPTRPPSVVPAPEPEAGGGQLVDADLTGWDPSLFKAAVAQAADGFEFQPDAFRTAVAQAAGFELDPDLFRAALDRHANNAPAPPAVAPAPVEPEHYDATVITRAIREAIR